MQGGTPGVQLATQAAQADNYEMKIPFLAILPQPPRPTGSVEG